MVDQIIFVHGFRSGVNSSKWTYIKEHFPDAVIFEADYEKESPVDIKDRLVKLVNTYESPIVIGHSLGAFFATVAHKCSYVSSKIVLLNPSLFPVETLYGNTSGRNLPTEFLEDYENLTSSYINRITHAVAILEMGDEVVDQRANYEFLCKEPMMLVPVLGGCHSFVNFNILNKEINEIRNRPWI